MRVIIIGAGQAGVTLATSLRDEGFTGSITMIGAEPALPYQRPPLSKAFLLGKMGVEGLILRNEAALADQGIEHLQAEVAGIDREARTVTLTDGRALPYDHLVLATGARARLPDWAKEPQKGVHSLRGLPDALALQEAIKTAKRVVVVGGGFIGLEFAAVANSLGLECTVIEAGPRLLGRAVSPRMAALVEAHHRESGIHILTGTGVRRLLSAPDGSVAGVETENGEEIAADLVMLGIGAVPNTALAEMAGLACPNGITVDHNLLTSDPAISAIGDCAHLVHPASDTPLRLESVQNALDSARAVAIRLSGKPVTAYAALPWFWSDQGKLKLQMAGLAGGADQSFEREQPGRRAIYLFRRGQLVCVETMNWPAMHLEAKRLLAAPRTPTHAELSRDTFSAQAWLAEQSAVA